MAYHIANFIVEKRVFTFTRIYLYRIVTEERSYPSRVDTCTVYDDGAGDITIEDKVAVLLLDCFKFCILSELNTVFDCYLKWSCREFKRGAYSSSRSKKRCLYIVSQSLLQRKCLFFRENPQAFDSVESSASIKIIDGFNAVIIECSNN